MSRGGSYGGGKSSLGYLFGSDRSPSSPSSLPPAPKVVNKPPWGDDNCIDEPPKIPLPSKKPNVSNNFQRAHQGPNSSNFITDRPSTKVQSVPGGDSTVGYLFGDEK
ncbi:hypothetical protein BVC80_1305g7 [Macleaya cordata]|uniref:Protein SPIRAL1-like 5 n=1 Tax=Macleaya cordata TaxID=56857 RepID=A0A200R367_MACCD|nr:hypothetical protein BVC80_1305g7 [Macleaya cordata]